MYEDFYKLALLPFENTPDPRFFLASEAHRETLAAIVYTIRLWKGFALITGDVGTGETTVGQVMRQRCGDQTTIVEVTYGHLERNTLLRQILRELNIATNDKDDHSLFVQKIRTYLMGQIEQDRPVVLFVDEAQTLGDDALEELRLMSNLDTAANKAIQIVLVAQPELLTRLRDHKHAALRQCIVMSKQIIPLNRQETSTYIHHRIAQTSIDPENPTAGFDIDAIDTIYQYASGIPRMINITCGNCLLMGYVREQTQIASSLVQKVVSDMIPDLEQSPAQVDDNDQPDLALAGGF